MKKRLITIAVSMWLLAGLSAGAQGAPAQTGTEDVSVSDTSSEGSQSTVESAAESQETRLADVWEETYTYLADSQEEHIYPERIVKNGVEYQQESVQYEIKPLTRVYIITSPDMWAGKEYTSKKEVTVNGLKFGLVETTKEEWQATGRTKPVTAIRTYLQGQQVPETLDVETKDTVTGETLSVNVPRTDFQKDGADWQEGALEELVVYEWTGEEWILPINGEICTAGDNPDFDGYQEKILELCHLDPEFYEITGIAWEGDTWENENKVWFRNAKVTGNRMLTRYRAVFSGNVPQPDLPMVRYTDHYVSDPTGYLMTAHVTYRAVIPELTEPVTGSETEPGLNWQEAAMLALEAISGVLLVVVAIALFRRWPKQRAWKK